MRAAVLANYVEVATALGLRPDDHLRAVGLTRAMISTPDRLISSDAAVRLMEETAVASECSTVGLRMSEPRPMSHFGIVGLLLNQQRTLRDAIQMAVRYLPLMNQSLALALEENGRVALLREEVMTNTPLPQRQATELAMAANVKIFRAVLGSQWNPSLVHFRHAAPASLELHQRIFRCRCEFSSDINAMSFPARDLDAVNPAADPMMASYALGFVETLPGQGRAAIVTDVMRQIYLLLPLGKATIKQVAQSLACSVRKVQLDLDREGTSFAALIDEARRERVGLYLNTPKFDLGHISELLGYRHQSSFTRWFVHSFGAPPRSHRSST